MKITERILRKITWELGYDLKKKAINEIENDPLCENFNYYEKQAKLAGKEINEWIENDLGWGNAETILFETVYPLLKDNFTVCEIGSGTGRHIRHIIPKIKNGKAILLDHSPWIRNFLTNYFKHYDHVEVKSIKNNLIELEDNTVDLFISFNTFIEFKIYLFRVFARQFSKKLKDGGYVVFNYLDIDSKGGQEHLILESEKYNCFDYHTKETVEKIFSEFNLELIKTINSGYFTYVIFRKKTI